jgi:hypothetical protein
MAGSQPEVVSVKSLRRETGRMGDWLAPAIALVAIAATVSTLISAIFESVR